MAEAIIRLLTSGATIFSDERRRYHSKKLHELLEEKDAAINAKGADYTDARVQLAQQALDNYVIAYSSEFEEALAALKEKANV